MGRIDAGGRPLDAGVARADGGRPLDAGARADGGRPLDASVPRVDARVPVDAARPVDAGVAVVVDAGVDPRKPTGPLGEPSLTRARELCITKGTVAAGDARATVDDAAVRGFARGSTGDSATLSFTYLGLTDKTSELASGDVRAQIGLKLRAQNSCNVIYVMWRVAPKSEITVQVKSNPGRQTHKDCGAAGYTRIKGAIRKKPPLLEPNTQHTLAAAIDGDTLVAWADHKVVWQGTLPATTRDLEGPVGFRTDNVKAELSLSGPALASAAPCPKGQAED